MKKNAGLSICKTQVIMLPSLLKIPSRKKNTDMILKRISYNTFCGGKCL